MEDEMESEEIMEIKKMVRQTFVVLLSGLLLGQYKSLIRQRLIFV